MVRPPDPSSHKHRSCSRHICKSAHLSNIDETAHQVLVAQRRNGVLSLVPRSVFHNSRYEKLATALAKETVNL